MHPGSPRVRARTAAVSGAVSAALAGLLLITACSGSDDPAPKATATAIADLDTGSMNLVRVGFCDLVPVEAVTAALTGPSTDLQEWGNGDAPPMDDAGSDVAHELGCAWARTGGYAARAWTFERPVTAAFANQVIASTRARKGCDTRRSAAFGRPGLVQVCTLPAKRTRVRHAGLFGDTWLTCEVAGPRGKAAPRARADAWCATIASTLDAER